MRMMTTPKFRAYCFIKRTLALGDYAPGETLRIIDFAAKLKLSTTPVREALCRLAGETLVEDEGGDGFRVVRLSAAGVADAYRLEALLIGWAIERLIQFTIALEAQAKDTTSAPAPMAFIALRQGAASSVTRGAMAAVADRLAPYRLAERDVLAQWAEEDRALQHLFETNDWRGLGQLVRRYARRRRQSAALLIAETELRREARSRARKA